MRFTAQLKKNNGAVRAAVFAVSGWMTASAMAATSGSSSAPPARAIPVPAQQQQILSQPAAPADDASPARSVRDMLADLRANNRALAAALGDKSNLHSLAKRNKLTPQLIPLEQRQSALIDELLKHPEVPATQLIPLKQRAVAMLYLLKDAPTVQSIDAMKASNNKTAATIGAAMQISAHWLGAPDATAASSATDALIQLDQDNPADTRLTMLTYSLSRETDDKASARLLSNTAAAMNNSAARTIALQVAEENQLATLEGKPLVICGKTPDGTDITTASWNGKVILVNFWSSSNTLCRGDVPGLQKLYADYHDKGFEMLGVSNDFTNGDLTDFTLSHAMPWPQLYDSAAGLAHHWNPITTGYGIREIPRMFLIDKKGICRSVDARSDITTLLPKLLAE